MNDDRTYTADRDLYLDTSGRVVEADDPARNTLLARAGQTLPRERADALGLGAAPAPDEGVKDDEPGETKAESAPAATKATTKASSTKRGRR